MFSEQSFLHVAGLIPPLRLDRRKNSFERFPAAWLGRGYVTRRTLCYFFSLVPFKFTTRSRRRGRSTLRSRGRSRGSVFRMCVYPYHFPGFLLPVRKPQSPTNSPMVRSSSQPNGQRVSLKSKLSEVQQVASEDIFIFTTRKVNLLMDSY